MALGKVSNSKGVIMTPETIARLEKRCDELYSKRMDLEKERRDREYEEKVKKRKQRVDEVMRRLGYTTEPLYGIR